MEQNETATSLKEKLWRGIRRLWNFLKPSPEAWTGAALGLFCALLLFLFYGTVHLLMVASPNWFNQLTVLYFLGIAAGFAGLLILLLRLLVRLPKLFQWILFMIVIIFSSSFTVFTGGGVASIIYSIVLAFSLAGSGLWVVIRGGMRKRTFGGRMLTVATTLTGFVGIALMLFWFWQDGSTLEMPKNATASTGSPVELLSKPDPSLSGPWQVKYLSYGSGADKRRSEYGSKAAMVTRSVDGSKMIDGWDGPGGWARTRYWGFDAKHLPLQARVWYPQGSGPFPLALIVHGNHAMDDFSEPGYEYLGQLLASRGFILASIDEDFLNGTMSDSLLSKPGGKTGLQVENDARAWLLLEHLCLWREWSEKIDNPFFGLVDWNNLALIGHSRGGEAVATATAFNCLPFYPDNALIPFDYNFNIRSVIAIAPSDGQYKPASLPTKLEDVNYFVLHGSNDMDAQSFMGARQFSRVTFSGKEHFIKCALYIYGANHGQFNSVWGRTDYNPPVIEMMNLEPIMPLKDQQKIAKVYISAFLEATLHDEREYERIFRDYRSGKSWLPSTIYLSQYSDSETQIIASYQEDIDLTSADLPGVQIRGANLKLWAEHQVWMKWGSRDTNGVYLGWNNDNDREKSSYTLTLPDEGIHYTADSSLVFSIADTGEDPPIDESDKGSDKPNQESKTGTMDKPEKEFIDCSIVATDENGISAVLPLSHYSALQPIIKVQVAKAAFMNRNKDSEVIFQSFEFPLAAFSKANPNFHSEKLHKVAFIFDRTPKGVVVLDDIGFRNAR